MKYFYLVCAIIGALIPAGFTVGLSLALPLYLFIRHDSQVVAQQQTNYF